MALLVVLATLVVVVTATTGLLAVAGREEIRRRIDRQSEMVDELLRALEAPIHDWLNTQSATVVLPLDAPAPWVLVLRDSWDGAEQVEVRISAWDQCGMVPHTIARSGSPLRAALAGEWIELLDATEIRDEAMVGLDLYVRAGAASVFPEAVHGPVTSFGGEAASEPEDTIAEPAFGALVATHNSGLININTAPFELLERALRESSSGDLEQILAARGAGEAVTRAPSTRGREGTVKVVGSSSAWAFRIDVRVGLVERSWWAVYTGAGREWRCVQRVAITK